MARQIWLTLTPGTQIAVDLAEAERLDERGFAILYRKHVHGATRKTARTWGRRQVAERERAQRHEAA